MSNNILEDLNNKNYSSLINKLNNEIENSSSSDDIHLKDLYYNRGCLYLKIELNRKALKVTN